MSVKAKIADPSDIPPEAPDTFEWVLPDSTVVVIGKPQGVHRLKLRDILTTDLLQDPEIVNIAKAMLCIRTIGGKPPILRTYSEFEFLLNRFGDDSKLDEFMTEFQKLLNPHLTMLIEEAMNEAIEQKLKPGQVQELIQLKIMQYEQANRDKVKV